METTINPLLEGKSISELEKLKTTAFKGSEGAIKVLDEYIASLVAQELADKAKAEFIAKVDALILDLPKPVDVHSVHFIWREDAEVEDRSQPPEMARIVDKPAVVVDDKVVEEATFKEVERYPMVKQPRWIVELNKLYTPNARGAGASPTASKRGITVYKRDGTKAPILVGNFTSGEKACIHLGIDSGKDSAPRKLVANGYVYDEYNGQDTIA